MSIASNTARRCLEITNDGILVLDHNQMISWINPALESMLGVNADQLVGRTAEFVDDAKLSQLFTSDGIIHLEETADSKEVWLRCRAEKEEESDSTIKIYADVTELFALKNENQHLQQQIEELSITDELTGLANRRALTRALNAQVTRSRRYQNPLCLAVLELHDNANPNQPIANELVLAASRYLRDRLRWVDVISRWDHSQFIMVLPETTLEAGNDLLEKVHQGFTEVVLPESYQDAQLSLDVGLAQWEKGFDGKRLMDAAMHALPEAVTG